MTQQDPRFRFVSTCRSVGVGLLMMFGSFVPATHAADPNQVSTPQTAAPEQNAPATHTATPETYRSFLKQLRPGDTLLLASGVYRDTLPLHSLLGTAEQPITIRGPSGPDKATFYGKEGSNTVSLKDSAYLVIESLVLDGQNLEVDGVKAEGTSAFVHDVTLTNLTIVNHGREQAIVGIAAHCPTWNWIIRNNVIDGAGTGMYLGRPDGSGGFVGGTIEGNIIRNTRGYNIEIKHQKVRPPVPGMPGTDAVTVIRGNTFVKSKGGAEGDMARPNLLVGHFPLDGPGSRDRYLIYDNLFFDNPTEALFQGEGNIALYNNLFINPRGGAVNVQPHNHRPREILIFSNTVVANGTGIRILSPEPGFLRMLERNAVFANTAISGTESGKNYTAAYRRAASILRNPLGPLGSIDLSPRKDALNGAGPLGPVVADLPDATSDFNGKKRNVNVFGACLPGARCP